MSSVLPHPGLLQDSAFSIHAPNRPCWSRFSLLLKCERFRIYGSNRHASRWQPSKKDAALQSRSIACMGSKQRKSERWRVTCSSEAAGSANWEGHGQGDGRMEAQDRQDCENTGNSEASTSLPSQTKKPFLRVPWKGRTIIQVMMLWTFAFVIHGQWIVPLGLELLLGLERAELSSQGEALLHMFLDLGMLGFTLAILWLCLRKYHPKARGWFRIKAWPCTWIWKVLLACAFVFPVAVFLADFSQRVFPISDSELWNAEHLEQSLLSGSLVTRLLYFVVLTVCAPFWEEVIFRGFLMPSLTKYMPLSASIAASALIFACVHFSFQRFLTLVLLGVAFGVLYAESDNLLTAVAAHSLWNMWVFVQFLLDARTGFPI